MQRENAEGVRFSMLLHVHQDMNLKESQRERGERKRGDGGERRDEGGDERSGEWRRRVEEESR
eukprot:749198-Hanusia_phi.AAC.3